MPIPDTWPADVQVRARKFLALWKYYRFSRTLSEYAVPHYEAHIRGSQRDHLEVLRGIALISYWIASLNTLVEGWTELKLSDPTIDSILSQEKRAVLKRYRNTVFHFQGDLDEPRIKALSTDGDVIRWVFQLGDAFQAFFDPHADGIKVSLIHPWLFGVQNK